MHKALLWGVTTIVEDTPKPVLNNRFNNENILFRRMIDGWRVTGMHGKVCNVIAPPEIQVMLDDALDNQRT